MGHDSSSIRSAQASPNGVPVPVAILGPTGYTGLELIEIILRHPSMHVEYLGSAREKQPRIDAEFPRLFGRLRGSGGEVSPQCQPLDHDAIAKRCRLAFLCLPHEAAMEHAPKLLERGVRVVDLSAAYRIKEPAVYEKAYGHRHTDVQHLEHAVYGLTEVARLRLKDAMLCANPGCYPTAAGLSLLPLLKAGVVEPNGIIVNAASGVSGAGREPKPNTTLVEAGENYSAYGIGVHRHQPEINQTLHLHGDGPGGVQSGKYEALFVPHLLPIERGILETIYATPTSAKVDTARVMEVLTHAYAGEAFVKVRAESPTLHDVQRTNTVHINARVVCGRVVILAAIDNLVKGASGQAVQNANVMLGLPEAAGLV